jgi:RHS repeat-associated protein
MKNTESKVLGILFLSIVVLTCPRQSRAQSYVYEYGSYPWTTPMSVPGGYVDAGNGNLHIEIPIASIPERGRVPFVAKLVYDSHIWQQVTSGSSSSWKPTNVLSPFWSGWRLVTSATTGSNFNYRTISGTCTVQMGKNVGHPPYTMYENFSWTAPDGHIIPFTGIAHTYYDNNDGCGPEISTGNAVASDASGYHLYVTNYTTATVYAPDGTQVFPNVEDTNGNYYSVPNSNGDVTDTLGRTPITTTVSGNTTTYAVLNSQGTTSSVVVTTETLPVNTLFGQANVTECSTNCTVTVIESISFPDGTSYQFSYDEGSTGTHYGELTAMTLPTGGTVTFGYENFKDSYGNQNEWATSSQWGGSTGGTWSFTPLVLSSCPTGCTQQMTEVAPSGEKTVFGFALDDGAWNTTAASYDTTANGGGLLQTITTAYNFSNAPVILPTSVTTTVPVPSGNISKKVTFTFDTSNFGNITAQAETNFFTTAGGAYRTTDYTYLSNSNNNMVNKKQSIAVCLGAGPCTAAQLQINYDGTTTSSITGVIQHDDTKFGTSYNARGNSTSIVHTDSPTNETTTLAYDMTGQLTSSMDMNGNITKFSYADNYFKDTSSGPTATTPAGTTNAYLTRVTLPAPFSWTLSSGYYLGTGQLATKTDQNGVISTLDYFDPSNRPTSSKVLINATNYSWTTMTYASSSEVQADSYTGIADASPSTSCSSCRHDEVNLDSFGRRLTQVLVNDPEGADTVTATYANGRLASVTNAKRTSPSNTDGSDSYTYDGLGRVTKVTHSDGSSASTYYGAAVTSAGAGGIATQLCSSTTYGLGYPVLVVDEAGKMRQSWRDAFGRTIELDEPNNSGALTQNTCYTYDVFNNVTGVTQGSQTRTYLFDSLSRLASSTTPEIGTIQTIHTNSRQQFCSGNPALLCQIYNQTSQVTTTFAYDQLNRLTGVSYSDNKTPTVTYTYDGGNQKGFLTGMTDGSGTTTWTYNNVGWPITEQRTIAGITKTISYTYNGDGSLATITYPSGRKITYSTSNAQRTISATDVANSIQYAITASYSPVGTLNSVIYGSATGFNGITNSASFNSRLEPTSVSATSSAGTAQSLSFNFSLPTGNDGTLAGIQNNETSGLSESFTYDPLNRILSAATTATSGAGCWGQSFGPSGAPPPGPPDDQWGNLTSINVTNCSSTMLGISVNAATNRVSTSGYTYDSSGNMTVEPSPLGYTYTYDASSHLIQAAGTPSGTWTYVYDGKSLRVEKSNASGGTLYWRASTGQTIAETDLTGSTTDTAYREYIFFGGRRIAMRDSVTPNPDIFYYYTDQLGSTTAITTASGTPCYQATFTPYGQEMTSQTTCQQNYKFTGYERDAETGLDYAFARYYNSRLGRFMSPDPMGGGLGDPQSLNRYAYVGNSPLGSVDPTGMDKCELVRSVNGVSSGVSCLGDQTMDFMPWIPWLMVYSVWSEFPCSDGICTSMLGNEGYSTGGWINVGWYGDDLSNPIFGRIRDAITNALQALNDPKCRGLFNQEVDPSLLLQQLAAGDTTLGWIGTGDLGGVASGSLLAANTTPILGSTTAQNENGNTIVQSAFVGANITINSNASAPFSGTWPAYGQLSAYSQSQLDASTILHELGHSANFIFGPGSSALLDDGPDVTGGTFLSHVNTTLVLNDCFGGPQ